MSEETAIAALIEADDDLIELLPGGIYTYEATKRNGIGRKTTPDAYDSDGFLRPCCLVKARATVGGWGGLRGNEDQVTGTRQVVEIWLYDIDHWTRIRPVRDAVRLLLQRAYVTTLGRLSYLQDFSERDPALNNAAFYRIDFELLGAFGG